MSIVLTHVSLCCSPARRVLGMWLAHGHELRADLSLVGGEDARRSPQSTIDRLVRWFRVAYPHESEAASRERVVATTTGHALYEVRCGPVLHDLLVAYRMLTSKHLPLELLTESRSLRQSLLDGLVDGAATLCQDGRWELAAEQRAVVDGCIHLARGLGCRTGQVQEAMQANAVTGEAVLGFRFALGGVESVSSTLPSKRSDAKQPTPSPCGGHGFSIESVGAGSYYGFTLDGNGRCLLSDFVVTHNTVQVVPHITDAIQNWIERVAKLPVDPLHPNVEPDVCMIEFGGTVGDIESMVFLEALRQLRYRIGDDNLCHVHVSLVPVVGAVGEPKVRPHTTKRRDLPKR